MRPVDHGGRCRICDAPVPPAFALCYCCEVLVRQLQMPLVPMTAIAHFRLGDAVHRRLRSYKDGPVAEGREASTRWLVAMVEDRLATGGKEGPARLLDRCDLVVTVPSSSRPLGAPVDALVCRIPRLAVLHRPILVRGSEPTRHLRAARGGFVVGPAVDRDQLHHRRVLVVDDTVVTGARAQSAAAALRLAGAGVVGVLAIGHVMTHDRQPVSGVTRSGGPDVR